MATPHRGQGPADLNEGVGMAAEDRNDRERLKAIEMAVGQIEKQFG
jgi:hypothetical protein